MMTTYGVADLFNAIYEDVINTPEFGIKGDKKLESFFKMFFTRFGGRQTIKDFLDHNPAEFKNYYNIGDKTADKLAIIQEKMRDKYRDIL